jgi:GDP-4-dehydro-6-deoxy-D-mannose reductase
MNLLISGSKGFVGKYLCQELQLLKFDYEIFDRKDHNINSLDSWLSYGKKDILIFLSGKTNILDSWRDPFKTNSDNLNSINAALEYCRIYKVKLIYFSSFIYESNSEGYYKETDRIKPYNPYALSKILSEQLIHFYSTNFDLNSIVLRPFNIYGPGQKSTFLIPHIFDQIKNGDCITLKTIKPVRDYIHVKDVVQAIISVIKNGIEGYSTFNLSTGIGTSVSQIVKLISQEFNKEIQVIISSDDNDKTIMRAIGDNTLIKTTFKWEPTINIELGLKDYKNFRDKE